MTSFFNELFDLTGQTAIVIGAGSGIGKRVAHYLSAAGANVVVADINAEACDRVAEEIGSARALPCQVDVSDENSVKELFSRCRADLGDVSITVNCAAIFPMQLLDQTGVAEWDRVQAVNLRGAFLCIREAARNMRERGQGGRIVTISSIDSLQPSFVGLGAYGAAKAGINALTRTACLEYGADNITVNAIAPGGIATEGAANVRLVPEALPALEGLKKRAPLRRTGQPEDIAGTVLFLVSKAAGYITGQTLLVDGGRING